MLTKKSPVVLTNGGGWELILNDSLMENIN